MQKLNLRTYVIWEKVKIRCTKPFGSSAALPRVTNLAHLPRQGRQILAACCRNRPAPGYLIVDRKNRCPGDFAPRLYLLDISSFQTPFRSTEANAIAEQSVRPVRAEWLDRAPIVNECGMSEALLNCRFGSAASGSSRRLTKQNFNDQQVNPYLTRTQSNTFRLKKVAPDVSGPAILL